MPFDPRMTASRDYPAVALIGRCRACGRGLRVEAQPGHDTRGGRSNAFLVMGEICRAFHGSHHDGTAIPCGCGPNRWIVLKPLKGKHNPVKACSAKCQGATGPNCECACGGHNHGASYG